MRFTHLPEPGGLYDQHPKLLDDWHVIMSAEAKVEKARQDKQMAERGKPQKGGRRWGRRR